MVASRNRSSSRSRHFSTGVRYCWQNKNHGTGCWTVSFWSSVVALGLGLGVVMVVVLVLVLMAVEDKQKNQAER